MCPSLQFLLQDGKNLLALEVSPGRSTPYYYKADGVMEAYIRVGNESVIAPDYIVNELILKGSNQSFNTLTTDAVKKDYSFTLLEATYLVPEDQPDLYSDYYHKVRINYYPPSLASTCFLTTTRSPSSIPASIID